MASSVYTSIQFKPINTKGKIANTVNGNGSKTLACELSKQARGAGEQGKRGRTVDQGTPPMTAYTNIRPKTAQGGGQQLDWDIAAAAAGIIAVWHVVWFAFGLCSPIIDSLPSPCLPRRHHPALLTASNVLVQRILKREMK